MAISGQVTAPNPTGVAVNVQPASLVDQASNTSLAAASSGPVGKLQGSPGDPPPGDPPDPPGNSVEGGGGAVGATFSTSTIGSGFFTFPAQFPSPGNYLVTFSKPGYATQKFVVAATGAPVNLNVNLTPGAGSLSGEVFGPDGPLGGATVTVTDGTVTCSARTPTRGAVGKWSISGMTTPDTYLITATAPGYGASTTLVTLAAGQSSAGAKLILKAGVVSLVGNVASPKGPLGGINVTATDGTVTQSVTTLTGARDLSGGVVGTYVIPNLSVKGPWTVTASGPGWISQTQRVGLSNSVAAKSGKATANFDLSATTATVSGTVASASDGLGGVGVVMTGESGTYKALTATSPNAGAYDLSNVLPGHYVLLFALFGYQSESVEVDLSPGQILAVPPVKMPPISASSQRQAVITGDVVNLTTGNAVTNGTAQVDADRALSVPLGTNGSYIIPNLGAGIHKVTVSAPGYEPVTVVADVAMDATAVAPLVLLPPLVAVSGVVTSNDGGTVAGAFVSLAPRLNTERCGTASNPSAAPTALVRGPAGEGMAGEGMAGKGVAGKGVGGKGMGCLADANGDYRIVGLSHGTYNVSVQSPHAPDVPNPSAQCAAGQPAPCGYYDSWVPTNGSVTVLEGQSQIRNFAMDMDGSLDIDAETPGLGGIMGQVSVGVTVTGPFAAPPASPATSTSGSSTTAAPTTAAPTTAAPTTVAPTTVAPTTVAPTTVASTTVVPSTAAPTTVAPTTVAPTTAAPTGSTPSSAPPSTFTTTGSASQREGEPAGQEASAAALASGCPTTGQVTETLTEANAPVVFQGLPAGVYDVCFGPASNSNGAPIATMPNPAIANVGVNSTGSYSAVMLPSGITISGSLSYQVDGKVMPVGCKAAAGATCSPGSVTATWQYYDRAANPPTLLNGTFTTAIDPNGFFEFSNVPFGQQVASPTVNLQVNAGGFSTLNENNIAVPTCSMTGAPSTAQSANDASTGTTSCLPGYFPNITLSALASAVTGSVVLHTGLNTTDTSAADLSSVTVAVESGNGSGSNVAATVNGNGQIVWHDPAAPQAGWAEPGRYELAFSAAGYDSPPPVQLTVPINTTCTVQPCAAVEIGAVHFYQHPSVTVQAVNSSNAAINGATFVLYDPATTPPTLLSTQVAPAGSNSVTFNGLNLHSQPSYNYELEIYQGCVGAIVSPFNVSYGQSTDAVTVQNTSCIEGKVSGVVEDLANAGGPPDAMSNLVSPLAGVTVSAGSGLSAVTAPDGSFTILGNATASTLGVPAGSYTLSVSSVSGYGAATFWDPTLTTPTANPVTVASGQTTTVGIALVATDITVSGQVTDQAGGNAIPGASVFFQGALPTPPAVPGACNSNGTPPPQPSRAVPLTTAADGSFTVCLPPSTWDATFSEANFSQQKVAFTLVVGSGAKTLNVQMSESLNMVTGTVSELIGQFGPAPLTDLPASAITVADDGPIYCGNSGQSTCPVPDTGLTITAPGNGQFQIAGVGSTNNFLRPGENYSVAIKVPGFQPFSQDVEFTQSAGFDFVLSPTLDADTATVVVDVVTSASGAPIVGASVALTPPGQESTPKACPTTVATTLYCASGETQGAMTTGNDGAATFNNVPLGDYQVDVNGTAVAASTASTNFCDDLAGAEITGCVAVTSQGQPVNAGTVRLNQATTVVITGETQNSAATSASNFVPRADMSVALFSGNSATGTPLATGFTATDGTFTETVTQPGQYTAQLSFPGWQTTAHPFTVLPTEPNVNVDVSLPVTAWYTSVNAPGYTSPPWTLSVFYCAPGSAGQSEVNCSSQAAAGLVLSSPNGPDGTFVVDAVDTPSFNGGALLPSQQAGPYVAEACETALGTVCSSPVSVQVDNTGDPIGGPTGPTVLSLPQAPSVPPAPTELVAQATTVGEAPGSDAITFAWNASATATGYDVYEGASPGAEDTSTPACSTTGALSCTVTGLSTGNAYYFVVEATNIAGFSAPSTELRTTPGVELPPAPTGLTATATTVNPSPGADTVTLAWNVSATATGYDVYEGASPGAEDTSTPACSTTGALSCTVTGLSTGNAYYFVVEATNIAGFSAPSTELRTTPGVELPPAPTGLTATATTVNPSPGADTVTLAWNAAVAATGYNVLVGTTSGGEDTSTPACSTGALSCTVTGLTTGNTYFFVVEATNLAGPSAPSTEIQETLAADAPTEGVELFIKPGTGPSSSAPSLPDPGLLADPVGGVPTARGPRARGPGV